MNRLRLTLILILIPFHFVFSQSKSNDKATVYGELSHERYKAPIVDANVLLVQVNGNKVDSTYRVSTRNGIFIYKNLKPGKVYIKVSKMGMESVDGVCLISPKGTTLSCSPCGTARKRSKRRQ